MNKKILFSLFLSVAMLFSCQHKETPQPVNELIEEFTSGETSRHSDIRIVFTEPVPDSQRKIALLEEAFDISPKVEGSLMMADDKTLVFSPKEMLDRKTNYRVTVHLDILFGVKENKKFKFSFETPEPNISFQQDGLDVIVEKNDTLYEMKGTLILADWDDSTTVHQLVKTSEPVNLIWDKQPQGKKYSFRFRATPDIYGKTIKLSSRHEAGYPKKELAQIAVPGKNSFDVYSIEREKENEQYIEVAFTRPLDETQDFTGLVELLPDNNISFSVADNKLKVWVQNKNTKTGKLIVHDGIRALNGHKLKTDISHRKRYEKMIAFSDNKPSLEFVKSGNIIPYGNNMEIPFYATSLRGVIVRVIKVYENNMGQFLQDNNLSSEGGLSQIGSLLCRKVIFLDEDGDIDLSEKHVFAVNLNKLIKPEPGALYRLLLSYNFDLTAYPCPGVTPKSKEEIIAANKQLEQEEIEKFGNSEYYYSFCDQPWTNYNWEERDNPCKPTYYIDKIIRKNLLSSSLGIMLKKADTGKIFISTNDIISAEPTGGVEVTLYTRQNQLIHKESTNSDGIAQFDTEGKTPLYLIAKKGPQRGYLHLGNEESLSMSAFDVAGEEVKKGTKGFIYTERGVWRPGDSIYISFILNDAHNTLPQRHPVTCELLTPSRQVYWKKTLTTREDNFYLFTPATSTGAPTGSWLAKITVGGLTFEKKLRIETIKPNRLSIDLKFNNKMIEREKPAMASLRVQWLTGAVANNLDYDIQASLVPTKTAFKGYDSYQFDDPTRKFKSEDFSFAKGKTNEQGNATIQTEMLQGSSAPGMLKASFLSKVSEQSGEASFNTTVVAYSPFCSYVGIQTPQKNKTALSTNKKYRFDLATVRANGSIAPNNPMKVTIYKTEWYWWWNADSEDKADYNASDYMKPVKSFTLYSNKNGRAAFHLSVPEKQWGTYYIQATDLKSGHQCALMAYFDSYNSFDHQAAGGDKANMLSFITDKATYQPGEKIQVRFPSSSQSKAILTVENGSGILEHHEIDCTKKETFYTLRATEEMQPNAYISITLLNPYRASDLPIRLYGVVPVIVNSKDARLEPIINAPQEIRPNTDFTVTVSEKNQHPMTFTIGIVDEGLLELTNFKTPSPYDAFFAKEALGVRTWDIYDYVMGAYGGKIEKIFSIGGDASLNRGPRATANRFKPVVLFKGPFTLNKGSKSISFKMPEYVGKARCMVVAAHQNQYGNAEKEIFVRQPVMVFGTLPRQLTAGDECMLPVTVFAMKENVGRVTVQLSTNKMFSIIGSPNQQVEFSNIENKVIWFKIKAKENIGTGNVSVTATARGQQAFWKTEIGIQSASVPMTRVQSLVLGANQEKKIMLKPFGLPGSNKSSIEVSSIQLPNLTAMVSSLDNYPYNCLEQLVSRAFPKLYLPSLGQYSSDEVNLMGQQVRNTLSKIRNYMLPGGSFSYWPGSTSTDGWANIYAFQFLIEAKSKGYVLPPSSLQNCSSYQTALAKNWKANNGPVFSYEKVVQAYRLYVLSIANMPEKGAMNRLRECSSLPTEAKWLLAASYARIGNTDVAKKLIETNYGNADSQEQWMYTMGSPLRVQAVQLITYLELGYKNRASVLAKTMIQSLQNQTHELNTQTTSWVFLSLCDFYKQQPAVKDLKFEWIANGKSKILEMGKTVWNSPTSMNDAASTVTIRNLSKGNIYVTSSIEGVADIRNQQPTANGILLEETICTTEGQPINPGMTKQGTGMIFKLKVANQSGLMLRNLMVSQIVPAGWEILNTRFYQGIDKMPIGVSYQDFRDDRVLSFIPELPVGKSIIINIHVNASYAGLYYMIPSSCGCMYNSQYKATTAGRYIRVNR